jgi:hypothetical protein
MVPMPPSFEPSLAAALAAVDASPALDEIASVPYKSATAADKDAIWRRDYYPQARYWRSIHSYKQVCDYLQNLYGASPRIPSTGHRFRNRFWLSRSGTRSW